MFLCNLFTYDFFDILSLENFSFFKIFFKKRSRNNFKKGFRTSVKKILKKEKSKIIYFFLKEKNVIFYLKKTEIFLFVKENYLFFYSLYKQKIIKKNLFF